MILCEPTRNGTQHVAFIAALMVSYRYAFPNETIELWSNRSKNKNVVECLIQFQQNLDRFRFVDIYCYSGTKISVVSKLLRQIDSVVSLTKLTFKSNKETIVFCSTHSLPLLYFRVLKRVLGRRIIRVFAVIHDISGFAQKPHDHKLTQFRDARSVFGKAITPICLNKHLAIKVDRILKNYAQKPTYIDIPCLWVSEYASVLTNPPKCLKFVFAGISKKGLDDYFKLASSIAMKHVKVEFWVAGSCSKEECEQYGAVLKGLSVTWLSQFDYERILGSAHYLILPFGGARYDNRVSATLLDAFSVLKPSICYKNSFVSDCFERMGDIGYQCTNFAELLEIVNAICESFPLDKYNQQCNELAAKRILFDCQSVGYQIRLF